MQKQAEANIARAIELLEHGWDPKVTGFDEVRNLAEDLKNDRAFRQARLLFGRLRERYSASLDQSMRIRLGQRQALCTYKDSQLPTTARLDRALEILDDADPLLATRSAETLGLAGAIYKRKWQYEALVKHLERSLAYYMRGFQDGDRDRFYPGINAAYVLDLLAAQEETEADAAGTTSDTAQSRRRKADEIRRAIVEELTAREKVDQTLKTDWWFQVTLGEAHFGLGEYPAAGQRFANANKTGNPHPWEYESTARQLASLSQIRRGPAGDSAAKKAVNVLIGSTYAVERSFAGKVGLALSGGGFRAALFHIGVLAKLAELDVLRHVEVLSCVSGGSIVGAHYYIKLKHLLETTSEPIPAEEYVRLVTELKKEFLKGVQKNIRVRVATNLGKSIMMLLLPDYSRTRRAGELYEKHLYRQIKDVKQPPHNMRELLVDLKHFDIKMDNWKRHDKVPMLVLNTTTLNTGHTWQFTGTWMGEPPTDINTEVDANYRLRRMYYKEAPGNYDDVEIGQAVAASACVPGIFSPLEMANLYKDKTVRLVDGGVHDNQGTGSLLEQECTILLVSDASGQMESEDDPGDGLISVPLRSNSILQARVREAEYADLASRVRSGLLQGLMFIHMKKGLDVKAIDWIAAGKPKRPTETVQKNDDDDSARTPYGVLKTVQEKLAGIRTDLDSFSNVEAHSLMASGYLMAGHEFAEQIKTLPPPRSIPKAHWDFMSAAPAITDSSDPKHKHYMELLSVSHMSALKVWFLSKWLSSAGILLLLGALGAFVYEFRSTPLMTFSVSAWSVVVILAGIIITKLFGKDIAKAINYRKTLNEAAIGVVLIAVGWVLAWLHLWLFDRLFLRMGRE